MADAPVADLRPVGPLGLLDRAFAMLRAGGLPLFAPAWLGAGLLVGAVLLLYYAERVEGLTALRPAFAVALVAAWACRACFSGEAARRGVAMLGPTLMEPDGGGVLPRVSTSLVVLAGLWCWLWLVALAGLAGPTGIAMVLPLFALRGAVAPSWLARAAVAPGGGVVAFFRAAADGGESRARGVAVELCVILGTLGLAANLYAAAGVLLLLLRSFVGLELAALESFFSPSNGLVLLGFGGLAVILLEPLRAAISAAVYVEARVRDEGLDLRAALDEALRHAERAKAGRALGRAAAVLLAVTFASAALPARAQDLPADDQAIQQDVEVILAQPEFREFEDHRVDGLQTWIERVFEWLLRPRDAEPMQATPVAPVTLPSGLVFLALGALLVAAVGAYLLFTLRRGPRKAKESEGAAEEDPRERSPESFLDEAGGLAGRGDLRQALRALYLATLVGLDRRRLIRFDPHHTNWHYLRQMPRGEARQTFREFTRLFDHKWYGEEATSEAEFRRCEALAIALVDAEGA